MKRLLFALPVCLLAACETNAPDGGVVEGWHITGVNAANLAAMAANPRDLIVGQDDRHGDGRQAAGAIDHIWQDRPKQLLDATKSASSGGSGATN
jgi:hypothetical protein